MHFTRAPSREACHSKFASTGGPHPSDIGSLRGASNKPWAIAQLAWRVARLSGVAGSYYYLRPTKA